jgi:hypothetical protein
VNPPPPPPSSLPPRRAGCLGCAGGILAGLFAAFALLVVVLLVVAAKSVPTRADHEKELRAHVTELLQEKKPEKDADSILQGLLRLGNAFAQGADVSYMDMLGFQYEEHTFYSIVKDPAKPKDKQLVSFGIMGKVFGPKNQPKGAASPTPRGKID